jgi:hypothetical protein
MFKFLQDKRLKKEKTKHAVQKERANYFVAKYMEENKKKDKFRSLNFQRTRERVCTFVTFTR